MDAVLWQVLAGTRGGPNRARLLRAVDERPRNANRLADDLGLSYKTVRHHLDVLAENDLVVSSGEDYGEVYLPSDRAGEHWDTVEEILDEVDVAPADGPDPGGREPDPGSGPRGGTDGRPE